MRSRHGLITASRQRFSVPLIFMGLLLLLSSAATVRAAGPFVSEKLLEDSYSLAGPWLFQPGDDLTWASPAYDDSGWARTAIPGRWPEGGYPETDQFAWYRLSLEFDLDDLALLQQQGPLGVSIGKVLSAYELYAGGRLLGGAGQLPPLAEVDYDRQRVFQIPISAIGEDGTLVLALRVWGGDAAFLQFWSAGPYADEFSLGGYGSLVLSGMLDEMPLLLSSILLMGFGVYHLYLYRRNLQLDAYLWFGLMAITVGVYALMLSQWKYLWGWPFITLKKIEFGVLYLLPALGIQLVWSLLQQPVGRRLRWYQLTFVGASLLVVLIPGHDIHYYTLNYWQLWSLPVLGLAPWLIVRQARAGNREARTLLLGALIFVATCLNDVLIDLMGLHTVRLMPYGFLAIMLAMAISLANRFTVLFNKLEQEVALRTAELSEANERLLQSARLDPLTGLLNRRGFSEEAEAEVQRVFRTGRNFALILADVDNFKHFNDLYGHACGDQVLSGTARLLYRRVRDIDMVARWGGGEFILLLPETDLDGATRLAEKLRENVAEQQFELGNRQLGITMTFGIAIHRKGEVLSSCISRADTALHHGKERGRNKVMIGSYRGLTLVN